MKRVIIKLKEAAAMKAAIAKQEVLLWKSVSEALNVFLRYQRKPKQERQGILLHDVVPNYDDRSTNRYMNTEQAIRYLGVGRTTLYRLRKDGLKCIKIGKATRWKVDDLDAFVIKNTPQDL